MNRKDKRKDRIESIAAIFCGAIFALEFALSIIAVSYLMYHSH